MPFVAETAEMVLTDRPDRLILLVESLYRNRMRNPVQVSDGEVTEGHHRVVMAPHAGVPVRYQDWDGP